MASKQGDEPSQVPRLYRELADWYPLLTPVGDYVEEAAFYRGLFETHCQRPPRTLLELGSGGGHNAAHLKATLAAPGSRARTAEAAGDKPPPYGGGHLFSSSQSRNFS